MAFPNSSPALDSDAISILDDAVAADTSPAPYCEPIWFPKSPWSLDALDGNKRPATNVREKPKDFAPPSSYHTLIYGDSGGNDHPIHWGDNV